MGELLDIEIVGNDLKRIMILTNKGKHTQTNNRVTEQPSQSSIQEVPSFRSNALIPSQQQTHPYNNP